MHNLKINLKSSLLVSVFALAVWISTPVANAGFVELAVSGVVEVGSTFEVDITVNGAFDTSVPLDEILTFGFDVASSDNAVFTLAGFNVAAPFTDFSQVFANTDVAAATFPGILNDGTNDSVFLGTLIFDALSAGTAELSIISDLINLNQGLGFLLASTFDLTSNLSIQVNPVSMPISEPSVLLLLGFGILGIVAVNRRRVSRDD